jgi:hypothetical protein
VGLIALRKLQESGAFPLQDVDPERVRGLQILEEYPLSYYAEFLSALESIGRDDMVQAIKELTASFRPWSQWRETAVEEIIDHVDAGSAFILADEDEWGTDEYVGECRRIPFTERDGVYWGPPTDDQAAMFEFERLCNMGAEFLVVGWPAFWWLEAYPQWANLLRSRFQIVLQNDRQIIFDMRV